MNKYLFMVFLIGAAAFLQPVFSQADQEISGDVSAKISKIEQNQEKILQVLEEIKTELQIVKVRTTSR